MKRLAQLILIAALALCPLAAQQHEGAAPAAAPQAHETAAPAAQPEGAQHAASAHEGTKEAEEKPEDPKLEIWKWVNFLMLAGLLGWMIGKNAGPFFAARSKQIRKDMDESDQMRRDAEAKAADVDRRLANLDSELAKLRQEAEAEQSAEEARAKEHAAAELAKLQHFAQQEIESAGKAARMELKRYSATLAIQLAEKKIQGRMTPETDDFLIRGFARDLDKPSSNAQPS